MASFKYDLTGQRFGKWTVLSFTGESTSDNDPLWLCKCDCGKERAVRGSSLRKGKSQSCGCTRRPREDLTGKRFDRLVVLEMTDKRSSSGAIIWKCQCDCGNICERSTSTLHKKGEIHSCGCSTVENMIKAQEKNLIGQRFGKLTVIELTDKRTLQGTKIWKCRCDCGNICEVRTNSLTTGNTSSCGCINYSIGEKHIEELLKKHNIQFKAQFTEPSLQKKRFDFALLGDSGKVTRLIEFDGKQHYSGIQGMWNSKETLQDIQARDHEKNEYALTHNIPLVRIPYWERDNITLDMLLGDKYLVTRGE